MVSLAALLIIGWILWLTCSLPPELSATSDLISSPCMMRILISYVTVLSSPYFPSRFPFSFPPPLQIFYFSILPFSFPSLPGLFIVWYNMYLSMFMLIYRTGTAVVDSHFYLIYQSCHCYAVYDINKNIFNPKCGLGLKKRCAMWKPLHCIADDTKLLIELLRYTLFLCRVAVRTPPLDKLAR